MESLVTDDERKTALAMIESELRLKGRSQSAALKALRSRLTSFTDGSDKARQVAIATYFITARWIRVLHQVLGHDGGPDSNEDGGGSARAEDA